MTKQQAISQLKEHLSKAKDVSLLSFIAMNIYLKKLIELQTIIENEAKTTDII